VQAKRHEQRLTHDIPVGQPALIVPHSWLWCFQDHDPLNAKPAKSRLRAGLPAPH
jgi:hypothetical protein